MARSMRERAVKEHPTTIICLLTGYFSTSTEQSRHNTHREEKKKVLNHQYTEYPLNDRAAQNVGVFLLESLTLECIRQMLMK